MTSDRTFKKWSVQSKDCYERKCECSTCTVYGVLGKRCRMKETVEKLLEEVGEPPEVITTYEHKHIARGKENKKG